MTEAATKLKMEAVPLASAATIYHKFFQRFRPSTWDPYLIAATSLYLAAKLEEEHLRLRDIINVCYRTFNKDQAPLDIGVSYWCQRENLVQCELYVIRALRFHVSFTHPHKFLLHYLKSVYDWLDPVVKQKVPVATTAWAILRDSYHGNVCLEYSPEHIAVAVLFFALQCHGVEVPYSDTAEYEWWQVLTEDITLRRIRAIISAIIDIYDLEVAS